MNCTFQETVGTEFEFPVQRLLASDRKKSLFKKFAKIENSTTGLFFKLNAFFNNNMAFINIASIKIIILKYKHEDGKNILRRNIFN